MEQPLGNMTTILVKAVDMYNYIVWEKSHPKVADYCLLGSPLPMLSILALYLVIIFKGPKLMKHRKPFDLKLIMVVYNIFQTIINVTFIYVYVTEFLAPGLYKIVCQPPVPLDFPDTSIEGTIILRCYQFFLSRTMDLLDTVFMVLRKNERQISFLHVYHHIMMSTTSWVLVKYIPGGDPAFFCALNCFVHAIMYTYYLITAVCPEYKGSLWWKRHLTELQMCQFGIVMVQFAVGILTPNCQYPKSILIFCLIQVIVIFALFLNFYVKTYLVKQKK